MAPGPCVVAKPMLAQARQRMCVSRATTMYLVQRRIDMLPKPLTKVI